MNEYISGNTKVCLADFFRRFGKSEALSKFVEISRGTETSWRLHGTMPNGETLLRLQHFLNLVGYQVEELLELNKEIFIVGQAIALNVVNIEKLARDLKMEAKHLHGYFHGGILPSPERLAVISAINSRNEAILEIASREKKELLSTLQAKSILPTEVPNGKSPLIDDFAVACDTINRLGKKLLDGPAETRFAMRRQLGQGNNPVLHCTWETLNLLLNERKTSL